MSYDWAIDLLDRRTREGSDQVEIYIRKVRFKAVGKVGKIALRYDRATGLYFEEQRREAAHGR